MNCTPPPKRNYVEPETLVRLTKAARSKSKRRREKGIAEIVVIWEKIARGTNQRYRFVRGAANVEDFVQECLIDLLYHGLPNADTSKNLFSYFTRICQNCGRKAANERSAEATVFAVYRDELIATHISCGFDPEDSRAETQEDEPFPDETDECE